MAEAKEAEWIRVQKKTFTKWLNNNLKKKQFEPVEDLYTAWEDGVKLMETINALYDLPMPKHKKECKIIAHKMDNLTIAFKMIEEAQIKTNFLKLEQLLQHDGKMILGMVWAIILDYAIKGISVGDLNAKEGLLLWVQKKTKGYNHVDPPKVKNFSKDWKSGMAFCALIHRHYPNLINYDELDPKNAEHNLELAFKVAEEELDIPRLLDVEDLMTVRPDERSVMTYVSEFFHRFAGEDIKENAARRVLKFLDFMRRMQGLENDYERRARELLAWSGQTGASFDEAKFGDSVAEADEAMAAYRKYVVEDKPGQMGVKLDIDALYAEIQTELAVNGRHPYNPPDDCNPDVIDAAFSELAVKEAAYGKAVRENRFRFIEKHEATIDPEKLKEFEDAFNHFDKDSSDMLDQNEFKAALTALGVPFANDEAFEAIFNQVSGGAEMITRQQYYDYNIKLNEDKDDAATISQSFQIMAEQGGAITDEQLNRPPLTDEDVAYLKQQLTTGDDGTYDYQAFVSSQFKEE